MWSSCPCVMNIPAYLFLVLFEVADIRDNEVYTEHIVVGKAETAVYYDNVVARLDNGDILAYLAETAEHRDSYLTLFRVLLRGALLLAARAGCLVGQLLAALDPALRVRAFSSCISSRCSHCVVSVICSCHVVSRYSLGAAALLSFYVVINLFGRRTARFCCDRSADEIEIVVYAADLGDEKMTRYSSEKMQNTKNPSALRSRGHSAA